MASFLTCLRRQLCRRPPQIAMYYPSTKNLDMTETSETRSLASYKGMSVHSVFQIICFCLCELLRKVIHHCMSVAELLNINMCTRETQEEKVWPEHETWKRELKMTAIFDKTVDQQMKVMIQSDQLTVAEVLLTDWLECQSEEQDGSEDGSDSETEWSEEEDEGVSEMSLENQELWESFLNNSDPYNPLRFSCSTEDKLKVSANDRCKKDEEPVPPCAREKDETEWREEEPDWSDEEDLEMSAESRELLESFNGDPFNPLCFSCPTGVKTKSSERQQNHIPSSPTASEAEERSPEQSTKTRAKKVRFSEEVTIHNLDTDLESHAARDGSCWMEQARDRDRFKRRVEKAEEIIKVCLTAQHRARVFNKLYNHS